MTKWNLVVDLKNFLNSICHYLLFTIIDEPQINNYSKTNIINGGVNWSLPYEWLFYFILPIISIIVNRSFFNIFYFLFSILFFIFFIFFHKLEFTWVISFSGGILAAFIQKKDLIKFPNAMFFNILIFVMILVVIYFHLPPKIPTIVIFILISSGNNFFYLLNNKLLRALGDISYSLYLFHGFILFIFFEILIDKSFLKNLNFNSYAIVIFLITPLLVTLSYFAFHILEKPFMNVSKKYTVFYKKSK